MRSAYYASTGLFDKHKKLSEFTREKMDLLLCAQSIYALSPIAAW
jgi:hypothetical protein